MAQARSKARYRADLGGVSLKLRESRIVAGLLLEGIEGDTAWREVLVTQNVLQMGSPGTALRQGHLIKARLEHMDHELWTLVRDGSPSVALHAIFAAALKHSPLLADFMLLVVKEQFRLFSPTFSRRLWAPYVDDCRSRDRFMPEWTEATTKRLCSTVFRILVELELVRDLRSMVLQAIRISGEVLSYLRERDEDFVLRCIQVSP